MFSLSLGQSTAFVLNFVAIALAARFLGVENFGQFSSLIAIVGILAKVVDFGIEPIVFRELSKDKEYYDLINVGLTIKLLIFAVLLIITNVVIQFLQFTSDEIYLINILFLTIIVSAKMVNIREMLANPFKVHLKMHYPMTIAVLDSSTLLLAVLLMVYLKEGLVFFILIYTFSSIPGFTLIQYFLYKKFKYRFKFLLNNWKWLLKESYPLFGFAILITVFQQIDIILLKYFKSDFDAGIYSAASKLTTPLSIIPGAIVTTVFPILMQKITTNGSSEAINRLVIKLLYFISFIIAAVFMFKADAFVNIVFGANYIGSSESAIILYWSQVFLFFNFYATVYLIARNRQHYNFLYAVVIVLANLIFNIALIPTYSYLGAAVAKVLGSICSFIFIIVIIRKFKYSFHFRMVRLFVWSILVFGGLWLLSNLSLIPYVIITPILIIVLTFVVKFYTENEIEVFLKLIDNGKFLKWFKKS